MTDRFTFASILVCCLSATVVVSAQPPQLVLRRLTQYGELSPPQARALHKAVSKRMKRAAYRDNRDVVRAAVARAVLGAAPDKSSKRVKQSKRPNVAKVRTRLRAGLDVWALEHVFAPGRASMETCGRGFALSSNLCEALLAASAGVSLAGAHALGGGAEERDSERSAPLQQDRVFASIAPARADGSVRSDAVALAAAGKPLAPEPVAGAAVAPGAREPVSREPVERAAADKPLAREPVAREASSVAGRTRPLGIDGQPNGRELAAAPAEKPARPATPSAEELAEIARRKAEYQREREAYLERKRAEMAERKSRLAAHVASERVQRGPASEMEAKVAGLSSSDVARQATPAAGANAASPSSRRNPGPAAAPGDQSGDDVDSLVGDLLSK